ncbi:hypothetical protein [Bacillus pumilus]|uniref:hypothetical protein n=1 Tax=Bacillus pumilus TaxID=1408 RepID=UPI001C22A1C8|nr:hypothetical protein [Bacillus pumilus]MBU8639897.1 hypothetical protein [Bacillus pumilus]
MSCENCMRKFDKETMEDALMNWQGRDFIDYLRTHFSIDGQTENLRERVEVLRSLDTMVLDTALARVKGCEKIYENKHVLFFMGGLLTAATQVISVFSTSDFLVRTIIILCSIIVSVLILMSFKKALSKDNYISASLLSFREMLEQALAAKMGNESD